MSDEFDKPRRFYTSAVAARRDVVPMARDRIADWLRVDADAFDVELASSARDGR